MQVDRPNAPELTPEEQQQLIKLRELVEQALADGKLSKGEIEGIRAQLLADGKVTPEELRTIREATRKMLGDAAIEYEWS
jgi:hypothetical protein